MSDMYPYFFGYGSLVNRATHDFPGTRHASLHGWRRAWRHTDLRPVAFLTAIPDANCTIEGLIAQVPNDDWDALDQREWAYDRVGVKDHIRHDLPKTPDIAVYCVPEARHSAGSQVHPVLLSYIDVVIQGYLREFGEPGAARFFATTSGWDTPVLNDRKAPKYPRHQHLTRAETDYVDDQLAALSVQITNV